MLIVDLLADERVFVVARLVPRDDGRTDKIPTDPATGENVDPHDPANWLTGTEAQCYAALWNAQRAAESGAIEYGVGLVLGGGYWCVDIDHARDVDGWRPYALNFIERFPHAYVEVSAGLDGLHIIGRTTDPPQHGTRNKQYSMECYSRARFIYLTGHGAYGDPRTDLTEQFRAFATQFFPKTAAGAGIVNDGPCETWSGPTDDAELIARAVRGTSARAAFAGGVTFRDLMYGEDTAARFYAGDDSAADLALANHLAFWTGNDGPRMLRLMWQSALRRPKWDREDYLPRTIERACGDQEQWYNDGARVAESGSPPTLILPMSTASSDSASDTATAALATLPPPPPPPTVDDIMPGVPPELEGGQNLMTLEFQKALFREMCYVEDIHKIQQIDGRTLSSERFDATFGGYKWLMSYDGQVSTNSAWKAYVDNEMHRFPRANTQYFKPGVPTGTIRYVDGSKQINSYQPATIRRVQGDATPFVRYIETLLPNELDRRILLTWCASLVRNLGVKFKWAPFLQGVKGNGKTTLGRILEYCVSQRYTHWPKPDQLSEKFNAVFVDKILLVADETKTHEQRELEETLKLLVTATRLEVRPMYAEKVMKDVCFNLLLISNHKNGVRITKDERRYAPFYCAQQSEGDNVRDGLTTDYFVSYNAWLDADGFAIIYDYLMTYAIAVEYDPAGACVVAPATSSTDESVTASLGGVEQEILKAVENRADGFRGGWISSVAVDHLLARIGKDKSIPPNARRTLVMSCGYVPHPALPDGLCDAGWPDGTIPRLYVVKGHPWAVAHLTAGQVRDGYLAAQTNGR